MPDINPIEERVVRREKLKALLDAGVNPYPSRVTRSHAVREVLAAFGRLAESGTAVTVAGRLRAVRIHGGAAFADLEDDGEKIQLHFKQDILGSAFDLFIATVDHGDFIGCNGKVFVTKRGEKTVEVAGWEMLAKALRPLPAKWHGLTDTEVRYRKRYLDLLANPEVRGIFEKRSAIVRAIRDFLQGEGFIEVETPVLQPIAGGADARPFITHHNALDIDLYLRIAPELYLKRLVVGGFPKVFEMARCFRNEGIDHLHNPEFTQVEFYQAYADYNDLMNLTERLLPKVVESAVGKLTVEYGNQTLDFTAPYPRLTFKQALLEFGQIELDDCPDRSSLAKAAENRGVEVLSSDGPGRIIDNLYKKLIRPKIIRPTFVIDYPTDMKPLAKRTANDPRFTESFQLLAAGGFELLNAFTELNDPLDQRARFEEQERLREAGDEEAQRIDEDFLEALETGLPPTAGFGMGIDRLTALLTGSHSLKEVILFPTLRPEEK
ncbi:MAG: lysine--tRNA ligase [Patescibacteria group bacterium]|nr:lysine--tRNA ligase [Patescibacteria group bacterium]